jgi:Carboxypeptidase regulatory-like domain/TonB-dependent Receptor Plug Domain
MKKIAQSILGFALFGLTISAVAQQSQRTIRILAQGENSAPIAAATVTIKRGAEIAGTLNTSEKGEAAANLPAGRYEVTITKEGFEPRIQRDVNLSDDASVEIKFTLVPKVTLNEKIEVSASANAATLPEQTASASTELPAAQVKYLPNKPPQVSDALPLVPGVIRTFQGEIKISGSGENRSALIVNSADVTDPATGQFGMTVPVDSVETINAFKAPYLAQYGRFSAGVVSVETKCGGDKWNFELNDPLPEFRLLNGGLRGLREATPRIVFNGPLIKNRLYISEGSEYAIRKRPVRTLEFPNKETKSESINSFTQLDAILSGTHTLTSTFHFAPRRDSFVNLDFFNRRPVTPNSSGKDYT